MDNLLNDPKLHSIIVGAIVTMGIWFVKREVRRIDKGLGQSVKRSEFEQLRADTNERHQENLERLGRIEEGVTSTHRRIDEVFRILVGRGP